MEPEDLKAIVAKRLRNAVALDDVTADEVAEFLVETGMVTEETLFDK